MTTVKKEPRRQLVARLRELIPAEKGSANKNRVVFDIENVPKDSVPITSSGTDIKISGFVVRPSESTPTTYTSNRQKFIETFDVEIVTPNSFNTQLALRRVSRWLSIPRNFRIVGTDGAAHIEDRITTLVTVSIE